MSKYELFRPRSVSAAVAVFMALVAGTAAFAIAGPAILSSGASSAVAGDIALASNTVNEVPGATNPDLDSPEGDSPQTEGSSESEQAHQDGHGCDDTLFAGGEPPFAQPGGPAGCEAGQSGEHRKNGTQAGHDSPGSSASSHENGHGCDDTLFANGEPPFATPAGPAGCEVSNSAGHRQNGQQHGQGLPDEHPQHESGQPGAGTAPPIQPSTHANQGNGQGRP